MMNTIEQIDNVIEHNNKTLSELKILMSIMKSHDTILPSRDINHYYAINACKTLNFNLEKLRNNVASDHK